MDGADQPALARGGQQGLVVQGNGLAKFGGQTPDVGDQAADRRMISA